MTRKLVLTVLLETFLLSSFLRSCPSQKFLSRNNKFRQFLLLSLISLGFFLANFLIFVINTPHSHCYSANCIPIYSVDWYNRWFTLNLHFLFLKPAFTFLKINISGTTQSNGYKLSPWNIPLLISNLPKLSPTKQKFSATPYISRHSQIQLRGAKSYTFL